MTTDDIMDALRKLDGTNAAAVALISGLSRYRLNELGGVPEDD